MTPCLNHNMQHAHGFLHSPKDAGKKESTDERLSSDSKLLPDEDARRAIHGTMEVSEHEQKKTSRKRRRKVESDSECNKQPCLRESPDLDTHVPRPVFPFDSASESSAAVLSKIRNHEDYRFARSAAVEPFIHQPNDFGAARSDSHEMKLAKAAVQAEQALAAASRPTGISINPYLGGSAQFSVHDPTLHLAETSPLFLNRLIGSSVLPQDQLPSLLAARSNGIRGLPGITSLANQLLMQPSLLYSRTPLPASLSQLSSNLLGTQSLSAVPYNPLASVTPLTMGEVGRTSPTSHVESLGEAASNILQQSSLPPVEDGHTVPYNQRKYLPLAIDEDQNWLSEYHCFVRSNLVEVFRADRRDVSDRKSSKSVSFQQVGIRCRYCAHLDKDSRASRSSAFPFAIHKVYQSFTMVLRDHFEKCSAVPDSLKTQFLKLKCKTSMGAANAKSYWEYSAEKLGMVDSENGIIMNESTRAAALRKPPFGNSPEETSSSETQQISLVTEQDRAIVSDFHYNLLSQAQRIHLLPSERIGCRKSKSFMVGLAGFGCIYCCRSGRLGLSRIFPVARRTLNAKVDDFYNHIRRCTLCPEEVKEVLELQKREKTMTTSDERKEFFDRIWERLGHDRGQANV